MVFVLTLLTESELSARSQFTHVGNLLLRQEWINPNPLLITLKCNKKRALIIFVFV